MVCVLPGLADILASLFLLHSVLISVDLPTFDLPMNAYSGLLAGGQSFTDVLLLINDAERMIIFLFQF